MSEAVYYALGGGLRHGMGQHELEDLQFLNFIPYLFYSFFIPATFGVGGDRKNKGTHLSIHCEPHTFLGSGNEQDPIHGEPERLGLEGTEGSLLVSRPELLCCVFLPHNSRSLCTRQDND